MLGPVALSSFESMFDSPPKRLADSSPEPVGSGGGCSLARVGLGDVARVGVSDDGLFVIEVFPPLTASAKRYVQFHGVCARLLLRLLGYLWQLCR